jgi:hypothetical protein
MRQLARTSARTQPRGSAAGNARRRAGKIRIFLKFGVISAPISFEPLRQLVNVAAITHQLQIDIIAHDAE